MLECKEGTIDGMEYLGGMLACQDTPVVSALFQRVSREGRLYTSVHVSDDAGARGRQVRIEREELARPRPAGLS